MIDALRESLVETWVCAKFRSVEAGFVGGQQFPGVLPPRWRVVGPWARRRSSRAKPRRRGLRDGAAQATASKAVETRVTVGWSGRSSAERFLPFRKAAGVGKGSVVTGIGA